MGNKYNKANISRIIFNELKQLVEFASKVESFDTENMNSLFQIDINDKFFDDLFL